MLREVGQLLVDLAVDVGGAEGQPVTALPHLLADAIQRALQVEIAGIDLRLG
jgi:hypothetical protein